MKNENVKIGMQVYVNHLRPPTWQFACEKRQEGLEGVVLGKYTAWVDGAWKIRHNDGTIGIYYHDELEPEYMIYWYKVRKMYGYD